MMNEREVRSEFGQIIVESYSLAELTLIGQWVKSLENLFVVYKALGISDDC